MGQSAAKAALADSRNTNQSIYLAKAYHCYQRLNQSKNPSYEDQLNLALTQRAMGKYEDSNDTLYRMDRTYGEDYVIPMWMCYNYLELAKEQKSYEGILEDLKFRYQDCKHRYQASGESDTEMEELTGIMKELEE